MVCSVTPPFFRRLLKVMKEQGVIAGLDPEDAVHPVLLQIPDMRAIGTQAVFHHDQRQRGMVLPHFLQKTPGGVAFAVVLFRAVLTDDHLRRQGNHLPEIGMDDGGPQHLLVIGQLPRAALFHQAGAAAQLLRREGAGAVQAQQIAPLEIGHGFQGLAPLQLTKNVAEQGAQPLGINRIEDLAHLRVAGHLADAENPAEISVVAAALVKGQ
jgi:hypothetical protein